MGVAKCASKGGPKPAIGLSFPVPDPPRPEEPDHDENFLDFFISVSAAKSLLVDLQQVVDDAVKRKSF